MIKASVISWCVFLLGAGVSATLDPATGYALGTKPTDAWIATVSATSSSGIQAAECSHNTRLSNQKFAWFQIDPSKVNQQGSTYGTCHATTTAPSASQLEKDSGYDVFFWQNSGGSSGTGTGPIRDPNTGEPGYEDNSGKFHLGSPPSNGGGRSQKHRNKNHGGNHSRIGNGRGNSRTGGGLAGFGGNGQ